MKSLKGRIYTGMFEDILKTVDLLQDLGSQ
jgi:hypothetical protein